MSSGVNSSGSLISPSFLVLWRYFRGGSPLILGLHHFCGGWTFHEAAPGLRETQYCIEMDVSDLEPMIEELSGSVDDLEKALEPLLMTTVADTASKLPLLDKAKLQVLVTYALESILYCTNFRYIHFQHQILIATQAILKLNDVDAREHAVFDELNRVKQYFEKIKDAESGGVKKRENLSLDKAAAGRIIKHALVQLPYFSSSGIGSADNMLSERQ